jgi:hypothetical protein
VLSKSIIFESLCEKGGRASAGMDRAILEIRSRIWLAEKPSFENGHDDLPPTVGEAQGRAIVG